jgi:hypothetical protein
VTEGRNNLKNDVDFSEETKSLNNSCAASAFAQADAPADKIANDDEYIDEP